MAYSITTKDGITVDNIPDNIDPNSEELKERVQQERQKSGMVQGTPTIEQAEFNASGGYQSPENEARLLNKQFSGVLEADVPQLSPQYNRGTELVRNVAGTALFEFGDESEAFVRSKIGQGSYDSIVSELRDKQIQYRADHPTEALLTGIASGVITGTSLSQATKLPKVGKWLQMNKDAPIAKKIMKLMGIGGVGGGIAGAGAYDPTRDESLAGNIIAYGTVGALAPPILIGGGKTIGKGAEGIRNLMRNLGLKEGNPATEAIERIAKNLSDKGISPQEVQAHLDEARRLGLNDIQIGELQRGLQQISRQSMAVPTKSSDDVFEALDESKRVFGENAQTRLNKSMNVEGLDIDSDYIFKINQKQYKEAKKLYPEAYKFNIDRNSFKIGGVDIFNKPLIKQAWETYTNKMKNLSLTGEKNPTWKQLQKMKEIPTEYLHKIKMGLDDMVESNTDLTGVKAPGRAILEAKKLFDGITREFNPKYSKANDKYSEAFSIKDAFSRGQKYNLVDPAEMKRITRNMNDGELEAYRVGVLNNINKLILNGSDVGKAIFATPRKREALKTLFKSEKDFSDFEKMMKYQLKRKAGQSEIVGGSPTARREVEDLMTDFTPTKDATVFGTIISKLTKNFGMSEKVAEQLKKDLLLSSPERQKIIIQDVMDKYQKANKRGKLLDLIRSGAIGGSTLSTPNTLESLIAPHETTNKMKLRESLL